MRCGRAAVDHTVDAVINTADTEAELRCCHAAVDGGQTGHAATSIYIQNWVMITRLL